MLGTTINREFVLFRTFRRIKKEYEFWNFYRSFYKKFIFYTTSNQEELNELFRIRYQVYCLEYNYIDKNKFEDELETDQWDPRSVHFVIRDMKEEIAATVRLIQNSPLGLPIEKHFVFDLDVRSLSKEQSVEISRFIVTRKYRRKHLMFILIKGIYNYVKENNIKYVYSVMDERLYPMLTEMGIPFRRIGKPSFFQGYTFPCLMNVGEFEDELRLKNKKFLKYLLDGAISYNGEKNKYTIS